MYSEFYFLGLFKFIYIIRSAYLHTFHILFYFVFTLNIFDMFTFDIRNTNKIKLEIIFKRRHGNILYL